ncbi:hypothetical protein DH2020_034183 [Rehmannia glutinosa]|uniref:Peptidase S26 domain-containing protein n=1 Tax=Rehmannia glutinosa TaxID=99300 RepID=A0ABR0VAL2_REHGL
MEIHGQRSSGPLRSLRSVSFPFARHGNLHLFPNPSGSWRRRFGAVPENPRKTITKRIVGLEGDIVTFLVDPGRSDRSHSLVVPKGHVWIQGDNIYASNDSRHLGPVPYGLILGKVFCRMTSSLSWEFSSPMEESQVSCGHHKTLDDWHND